MKKELLIQSLQNALIGEVQDNLNLVTIHFSPIYPSGFQVNYFYAYNSITPDNLESISVIETQIISALSSEELGSFEIRSAIYQYKYKFLEGEIVVFENSR